MTEVDLLTEISAKLTTVSAQIGDLLTQLDRGWHWLITPVGEFGVLARITFGEMLLGILVVVLVCIKLIHLIYDALAPTGWW